MDFQNAIAQGGRDRARCQGDGVGVNYLAHCAALGRFEFDQGGADRQLGIENALGNVDVAKRILDPKLPIDPTMIELKPSQRSDLGRVIYANSITLTPGTVTTSLSGDSLEVHALTREGADDLLAGDMDRRVAGLERGTP